MLSTIMREKRMWLTNKEISRVSLSCSVAKTPARDSVEITEFSRIEPAKTSNINFSCLNFMGAVVPKIIGKASKGSFILMSFNA